MVNSAIRALNLSPLRQQHRQTHKQFSSGSTRVFLSKHRPLCVGQHTKGEQAHDDKLAYSRFIIIVDKFRPHDPHFSNGKILRS